MNPDFDPKKACETTNISREKLIDILNQTHSSLFEMSYDTSIDHNVRENLHRIRYKMQIGIAGL